MFSEKIQEITDGLNEVIGRLIVHSMSNQDVRTAMERLSDISIKFDKLAEELENEDFCCTCIDNLAKDQESEEYPGEQEADEKEYIKIEVTPEMSEKMDKCADGECTAEDCIDCCCQVCILQI